MTPWDDTRSTFEQAARWFAATVPADPGTWGHRALGEWTVRDLVGHTSRAVLTVESYLDQPPRPVEMASAAEYFARALASLADPAAVAQRGRDAGMALGDDLVGAVAAMVERLSSRLGATPGDAVAVTPVGAMYLRDYLPSRTFELTVHTLDLAAAMGLPVEVPEAPARESLTLAGELAARSGQAAALLLAATGRRPLPSGFSVIEGGLADSRPY